MTNALDEFERVLERQDDRQRCETVLEILNRWQWDRDLDERSRWRAGELLRRFSRSQW